ncbi:hypothetical protein Tsubulata_047105 [Turnera subulata]|uniref:SURP motif domain-containing protein n=2 Tax=Turnera subulata TaxID=218843 RepID=A0A9Q0JFC9_9ROSI|nr:hypothetical protein Tsubulata_047105 [Turnera subulata]
MDMDEEDFVFYGTPIEREEELTSRKKKAVAEASGHLRTLAPWKQEVRDEEGRRRFHGAFTGGYSAGYYNTVGSKEGWTPQSFTSSRKNRAEVKQQSILNFLDDDEKDELEGRTLATSSQFDTFGFTAAELARKQAEKEQQQSVLAPRYGIRNPQIALELWPSVIPGPVPDELVVPATESIDARREARKAFLAFSSNDAKSSVADTEPDEDPKSNLHHLVNNDVKSSRSTPVYVLNPKQDLYGLGYDPYKHAPEFREKKKSRLSGKPEPGNRKALSFKESLFGFKSGKAAPGFGIGALEEYDVEDEDVYDTAYDFEDAQVQDDEEPSGPSVVDHKKRLQWKDPGVLPGFRVATKADYQTERFDPPVIPKDFVPRHTFVTPLDVEKKHAIPPPPEVPPPEDNNLKLLIEGVASLVARCGKLFEDLSREKNQSNPLFSFLNGGNGHDYYARKLWDEQQKRTDQKKLALDGKSSTTVDKMTAESRGKILGERPLDRSSRDSRSSAGSADATLQFNLSDTFTKSESFSELPEVAKPFKDDPAKQERFERFLKEKYQGGLRSTDSGGASNMSEAARARERLDFEAAAEAIEKGKSKENKPFSLQLLELSASGGMQFTSGGIEQGKTAPTEDLVMKEPYPKRQEFQWRPSPILCKRFDLIDPYMGKPPPPPRIRSKMDSLIFTSDSIKPTKLEETVVPRRIQQSSALEVSEDVADREIDVEVPIENVERPVDLYKAIFSDDSDDEIEETSIKKVEDQEKTVEVAHTTLNRLMAGDFLESLGKELGIEVPPDLPYSVNNAKPSGPLKETAISSASNVNILPVEGNSFSSSDVQCVTSSKQGVAYQQEIIKGDAVKPIKGNAPSGSGKYNELPTSENKSTEAFMEKTAQGNMKAKSPPTRVQERSSDSLSEDERRRKRSRRRRYSSSDSHSDSSSDGRDRYNSRSEGRKGSSRDKRSSKRHSKHRKHGSRDSPGRSSRHSSKRGHSEAKRERRKWRD